MVKKKKISQGALVAMTFDGKIVAMIGGKNFSKSPFNRATQAYRLPGSAFKVFVYTTAVEQGYPIDTVFEDKPIQFGTWAPTNYRNNFIGEVTMAEAFAKSINTIAVQIAG